jgi:hypothetical protein
LKDAERLSRLLALLALAFTWAFVIGLWQAGVKELKLKKYGYPPKSIFRRGLNNAQSSTAAPQRAQKSTATR